MFVFCDVYYILIFITVFFVKFCSAADVLFYRRKNKYVLKVCLTDIKRVCDIYFFI